MKRVIAAFALCASFVLPAAPAAFAQSAKFKPVLRINDAIVTGYQLEQQERLMLLLNVPALDDDKIQQALVDDRLKRQAAQVLGLRASPGQLQNAETRFAQQFNLSPEQVDEVLQTGGVDKRSFQHFIETDLLWREVVRLRFGRRATVTDAEIDQAIAAQSGASRIEVTLAEIVLPLVQGQEEQTRRRARELAQITSDDDFAKAARQFSAAPTAPTGGKIDWIAVQNLPPILQPELLALAPGEIAGPIDFPGAVALFQLRGLREGGYSAPKPTAIEYARLTAGADDLAAIADTLQQCDDLYAAPAKFGLAEDALVVETNPIDRIPSGLRRAMASLDDGEWKILQTDTDASLIMVCGRVFDAGSDAPRDSIANALLDRRLGNYAQSYLAELRAGAQVRRVR